MSEEWEEFAANLRYVPRSAGPETLAAAVAEAEDQLGEGCLRLHYLSVPPAAALAVINMLRDAKLVEHSRVVMEKPFGTDLESAVELNARCTRRSTSRRSSASTTSSARRRRRTSSPSASPTGSSSRSGTATSSTTSRSTSPRPSGWTAGQLLRDHRRLQGHGRHPPVPGDGVRRDGAADGARTERDQRGEEQGLPVAAARPTLARGARPVRGLPPGGRGRARLRHRDVHRTALRARQLALGRGAVLPPHRQANGGGHADHLDRVQGGAAHDVPGGLRRRLGGSGPPDVRPRRRAQGLAVLLRQAARLRDEARQS